MSHSVSAEKIRERELRFVDHCCLMRALGVLACSVTVATVLHVHGNPYGALVWPALILNTVGWPYVAWRCARRAQQPAQYERRQFVVDGLFIGIWMAIIGCSPVAAMMMLTSLITGRASMRQWPLFVLGLVTMLLGLASFWLLLGRPWWPSLPLSSEMICLLALLVYVFAVTALMRSLLEMMQVRHAELHRLNRTDATIELPNRRYFRIQVNDEFERWQRSRQVASLLLIDIDHFKEVNDRHGHQAGDRILVEIAGILRDSVRSSDLPARYGGDEFAVLLVDTDRVEAQGVAERIRARFDALPLQQTHSVVCTLSIGVAEIEGLHLSVQDWINVADMALYRAKAEGRNRVAVAPRAGALA